MEGCSPQCTRYITNKIVFIDVLSDRRETAKGFSFETEVVFVFYLTLLSGIALFLLSVLTSLSAVRVLLLCCFSPSAVRS